VRRLVSPPDQRTKVLHDRYAQPIFNYCLRRLRSREEAEDAAQIVFLNAHRCLAEGVVPQSERAWIFKIAEHVVMYRWRTISRRARVEFPVDVDAIADLVVAPEPGAQELDGLPDALARLPEGQQRAIVLREWYGLSYREVAAELGLSVSATETLIFRARCRLAQELGGPAPTVRRRTPLSLASPLASLKWLLGSGTAVKALVGVTSVAVIAVGSAKVGLLPVPASSSAATAVQRVVVLPAVPASRHVVFVRAPVVARTPVRKARVRVVRPAVVLAPVAVVTARPVAIVAPEDASPPAPVSDEASGQVEAAPAVLDVAPAPIVEIPVATDDAVVVSQPPPADPVVAPVADPTIDPAVAPVADPTVDPAADPAAGTPVVAPPADPGQSGDVQGPNDHAAAGQAQRSENVPPNAADPGPPTDHGNGNDNGNNGNGNNGNGNGNSGVPPAHGHDAPDLGAAVAQ
jgi:RNA polymerase sigma factor (sigma-70 family)